MNEQQQQQQLNNHSDPSNFKREFFINLFFLKKVSIQIK